jgi:hypothetical protein
MFSKSQEAAEDSFAHLWVGIERTKHGSGPFEFDNGKRVGWHKVPGGVV